MKTIKIAIYGCGRFANQTHIPNLFSIDGVEIVTLCDTNPQALQATSERFNIPTTYLDGIEMLEREKIDVLYSIIPAFAREESDVEVQACRRGIHLFCEKPQALRMQTAYRINAAVQESGVLSMVGFRERYRSLFQQVRQHLQDKKVIYVRFQSVGGLPRSLPASDPRGWWQDMEKQGGGGLNWGVHAVDYTRFMTGQEVTHAQAFYLLREAYPTYLCQSYHFQLSNDAVLHQAFISATRIPPCDQPIFTIYYEGGWVGIYRRQGNTWAYAIDGGPQIDDDSDAWLEQDRTFINAVRTGDRDLILNDFQDGLSTLGPVLAGWESARNGGALVDVNEFMKCAPDTPKLE
jgi:myo-inositol 2-dehydrogenase/D-chiro-inositol 1-dehydrogenase